MCRVCACVWCVCVRVCECEGRSKTLPSLSRPFIFDIPSLPIFSFSSSICLTYFFFHLHPSLSVSFLMLPSLFSMSSLISPFSLLSLYFPSVFPFAWFQCCAADGSPTVDACFHERPGSLVHGALSPDEPQTTVADRPSDANVIKLAVLPPPHTLRLSGGSVCLSVCVCVHECGCSSLYIPYLSRPSTFPCLPFCLSLPVDSYSLPLLPPESLPLSFSCFLFGSGFLLSSP